MDARVKRKIRTICLVAAAMWFCGFAYLLAISGEAQGGVFETHEVSLTYRNFFPNGRDPLVTQNGLGRGLGQEMGLSLLTDVADVLFWNNYVSTKTDVMEGGPGQFRTIAWEFEFGARLTPYLELAYHHRSAHVLDHVYANGQFPVQDAIQLKLFLFKRKQSGEAVLPW